MPTPLFYIFALIMLAGGICVVALKNPVSSALAMITSFIGLAALFVGLNAYFVGVLQVLVYAGAIMVLFLFIIMLLDIKKEEGKTRRLSFISAGIMLPLLLVLQLIAVLQTSNLGDFTPITKESMAISAQSLPEGTAKASLESGDLPDVNLIGQKLFTDYNFPLQVVGVLLLVATVGCVALSKKLKSKG